MEKHSNNSSYYIIIIAAALGYFVDVYDLLLFSIVRIPSLKALGYSGVQLSEIGLRVLNVQMLGMLIGGVLWGIWSDKKGRLSVLFLTILLYSVANIANSFVQNLNQYYLLRFTAGLGLAGEMGIGVTLVLEIMSKNTRGYGGTIVSGIGIAGAIAAYWVSYFFDWRTAYLVGGVSGLLLFLLRFSMYESKMFLNVKSTDVKRGNFLSLFAKKSNFLKYLKCILCGLPVWFVIAIIVTLAPELGSKNALNVQGEIIGGKAVMIFYIGDSVGAFCYGLLSQLLKSRKRVLLIALSLLSIVLCVLFVSNSISTTTFYALLLGLGFQVGYWSVFVITTSEQFGTNLRATVTSSVPNFVRGGTLVITAAFNFFRSYSLSFINAAAILAVIVIGAALYSSYSIEETFHKDLDYFEEEPIP